MTILSVNDFLRDFTPPNYLIDNFLKSKSHGFLAGTTGSYKSFIALEIAHCIATGRAFLSNEIKTSGKVLYIAGEGTDGLHKRFTGLFECYGSCENIYLYSKSLDLSSLEDIEELTKYVIELQPILIIYDTLNSLSGGLENNSSSNVNLFYKRICNISNEVGSSTLIVHHYGKDVSKGMEGSHAFRSNADYVYALNSTGLLKVNLMEIKQKDRAIDIPTQIELREVTIKDIRHSDDNKTLLVNSYSSVSPTLTTKDRIKQFILNNPPPVSRASIKEHLKSLGINFNDKYLAELKNTGEIISVVGGYKANSAY